MRWSKTIRDQIAELKSTYGEAVWCKETRGGVLQTNVSNVKWNSIHVDDEYDDVNAVCNKILGEGGNELDEIHGNASGWLANPETRTLLYDNYCKIDFKNMGSLPMKLSVYVGKAKVKISSATNPGASHNSLCNVLFNDMVQGWNTYAAAGSTTAGSKTGEGAISTSYTAFSTSIDSAREYQEPWSAGPIFKKKFSVKKVGDYILNPGQEIVQTFKQKPKLVAPLHFWMGDTDIAGTYMDTIEGLASTADLDKSFCLPNYSYCIFTKIHGLMGIEYTTAGSGEKEVSNATSGLTGATLAYKLYQHKKVLSGITYSKGVKAIETAYDIVGELAAPMDVDIVHDNV